MRGYCLLIFFFFKQKTAYEMRISDWSSDVCSSDLQFRRPPLGAMLRQNPAASGRRNSEATGFGDVEQSSQNVTAIFGDQNLGFRHEQAFQPGQRAASSHALRSAHSPSFQIR